MKTYKTIIEKPRLEIRHDTVAENPRSWDNLGYFITAEIRYQSPDKHLSLEGIIKQTGDEAASVEEHMEMIKHVCLALGEKVLYITPVYRYEHGNVLYKRGTAHGFDVSNCGFYIVTEKTHKQFSGVDATFDEAKAIEIIDAELETYTKYANGEVYGFRLYDEQGEEADSCWGFYDIEDIREHLPDEWKNERLADYLVD